MLVCMDDVAVSRSSSRGVGAEVRRAIATDIFAVARSRLFWLPTHALLIAAITFAICRSDSLWLRFALSSLLGLCFAGLAFVAHEALHGAIVRGRAARSLVGFLGFLPFCLSPTLWVAWHNREHHGHTNQPGRDPDAYPTLAEYQHEQQARAMVEFGAPGLGRLRGIVTLLVGLSVQSIHMLFAAARRGYLDRSSARRAYLETALGVAFWTALAVNIGFGAFVFAYLVPLACANVVVMMHITTNHSLSPLTAQNDALANSLTVTTPRWFSFFTLGFGYHVEHHLFPAMSGRFAARVSEELARRYPESYQSMPLGRALGLLHRTARVYANSHELVDPKTGRTFATLPLLRSSDPPRRRPDVPARSWRAPLPSP